MWSGQPPGGTGGIKGTLNRLRANLAGVGEYCCRRLPAGAATADRFMRLRNHALRDNHRDFDPARELFLKSPS